MIILVLLEVFGICSAMSPSCPLESRLLKLVCHCRLFLALRFQGVHQPWFVKQRAITGVNERWCRVCYVLSELGSG